MKRRRNGDRRRRGRTQSVAQIQVAEITVDVFRGGVRNLNLRVSPPDGRVRLSIPRRTSLETARAYVESRIEWIRRHRERMSRAARERPPAPRYGNGDTHRAWGRRVPLRVIESDASPGVALTEGELVLRVRPDADRDTRRALVEAWHREQVEDAVPPLLARWEPRLGVTLDRWQVRRMKTRWGSCTPKTRSIRLNAELATRRPELLEYVVVHELVHLIEPSHDARFYALMDRHLPGWKALRKELDGRPA